MKEGSGPGWFSIMVDEDTDIVHTEQLNLSICCVNDDIRVNEDPIRLSKVSDTKAGTLFIVIKDLLIQCNLPLALCLVSRAGYDGC